MIGWYNPNEVGALTTRDAKPLYVWGEAVKAQVYTPPACDQHFIAIFIGLDLVHEGHLPLEVADAHDVNPFIQRFIEEFVIEQTRIAYRAACAND